MTLQELEHEISQGVTFSEVEAAGVLVSVMGVSSRSGSVTLIRHTYVAIAHRGEGHVGELLRDLLRETHGPILVSTWAAVTWAIRFYKRHGFRRNLERYCGRDTEGKVWIVDELRRLCR